MPHYRGHDRLQGYNRRFDRALRKDEERGEELEDEYVERTQDFDAREYARETNRAQFEDVREDLGRDVEDLRGSQASRGRLDTGFAFEDEDELVSETMEDFSRAAAARSMDAARLDLGATRDLGGYAERVTGRYLDVLAGQRDTELAEREQRRAQEARKKGGMFSFLGKAGGALLGPAGSAIGGVVGDKVGEWLG